MSLIWIPYNSYEKESDSGCPRRVSSFPTFPTEPMNWSMTKVPRSTPRMSNTVERSSTGSTRDRCDCQRARETSSMSYHPIARWIYSSSPVPTLSNRPPGDASSTRSGWTRPTWVDGLSSRSRIVRRVIPRSRRRPNSFPLPGKCCWRGVRTSSSWRRISSNKFSRSSHATRCKRTVTTSSVPLGGSWPRWHRRSSLVPRDRNTTIEFWWSTVLTSHSVERERPWQR